MIPNVVRGGRMNGVMAYLVGPGRSNEHENPHLIAGDDRVTFAVPVGTSLDANHAFEIGYMLDQPRRIHETEFNVPVYARDDESGEFLKDEAGKKIRTGSKPGHVWHCSLAVESGHGRVSDEQWEKIATEFVKRMGFVDPDGAKSSRWAAVHHGASKNGNDHIHLVVQLVREDGTKANINNDFHRAQTVCRELEKDFGLPRLESQEHGKGLAGEKPAERARADRGNNALSDKFELRRRLRAALATSGNAEEYVRHAQDLGVRIAPSFKPGSTTEVRGYKVSLGGRGTDERGIWYAPSKLDSTLAWNDIHARFGNAQRESGDAYLVSLHSSNTERERRKAVAHPVSNEQLERMMSHKTGPDTLANIYARLSLQFERNKPATFQRLSESYARAAQGSGNLRYAARLNQRFGAGQGRGWAAVAKQAGRLGRVMLEHRMAQDRPQFSTNVESLLKDAEGIINKEMQRIKNEEAASVAASKTPNVPYRDWNAGAQPGPGQGQGHER